MDAFNFVPFQKTPWAGSQISKLKKKSFPQTKRDLPLKIGESWEVSTEPSFPSKVCMNEHLTDLSLKDLFMRDGKRILGKLIVEKYGFHSPLLLKWLSSELALSLQLHPKNNHPLLKKNECGKPESWLILNSKENSFVYLGFQEGFSKNQIIDSFLKKTPEKFLYRFQVKKLDYISVPTGCVHALGPHLFLAEPQYVLPEKIAKTWRLFDWNRLYDDQGNLSSKGHPRDLHFEEALCAIDWDLPRGKELEKLFVKKMQHGIPFLGDKNNPFALNLYCEEGEFLYTPLQKGFFSILTVWSGEVFVNSNLEVLHLVAGESAIISADACDIYVTLIKKDNKLPQAAFFAFNDGVV
jgi:mannose-6-phosphate isomerase class I